MGIDLLDLRDIAAMKIQALGDRGARRDFIDLFFLAKTYSLDEMLEFYNQKYGDLEEKIYHIIRSLDYFIEAETEGPPKMLINISWEEIMKFFHQESMRLGKLKLDL